MSSRSSEPMRWSVEDVKTCVGQTGLVKAGAGPVRWSQMHALKEQLRETVGGPQCNSNHNFSALVLGLAVPVLLFLDTGFTHAAES